MGVGDEIWELIDLLFCEVCEARACGGGGACLSACLHWNVGVNNGIGVANGASLGRCHGRFLRCQCKRGTQHGLKYTEWEDWSYYHRSPALCVQCQSACHWWFKYVNHQYYHIGRWKLHKLDDEVPYSTTSPAYNSQLVGRQYDLPTRLAITASWLEMMSKYLVYSKYVYTLNCSICTHYPNPNTNRTQPPDLLANSPPARYHHNPPARLTIAAALQTSRQKRQHEPWTDYSVQRELVQHNHAYLLYQFVKICNEFDPGLYDLVYMFGKMKWAI